MLNRLSQRPSGTTAFIHLKAWPGHTLHPRPVWLPRGTLYSLYTSLYSPCPHKLIVRAIMILFGSCLNHLLAVCYCTSYSISKPHLQNISMIMTQVVPYLTGCCRLKEDGIIMQSVRMSMPSLKYPFKAKPCYKNPDLPKHENIPCDSNISSFTCGHNVFNKGWKSTWNERLTLTL